MLSRSTSVNRQHQQASSQLFLEQTESKGLIDRESSANTQPEGNEGANQKHSRCHRTPEGILELVDILDKRNQHQTQGYRTHHHDSQEFIGNSPQNLEHWIEVPLWQNFQRRRKGVCWFADHRRI